jgi:hypothetical protein
MTNANTQDCNPPLKLGAGAAIITPEKAIEEHFRRCADQARGRFSQAVRPLYLPDQRGRPVGVASATLLEFDGLPFLATAAHALKFPGLLLGGADILIPLPNEFWRSKGGGEADDKIDLAVAPLTKAQCAALDGLPFIGSDDWMHATVTGNRYTLAVGYRVSQNKAPVDGSRALRLKRWSFTGFTGETPTSGGYGDCNFALEYSKRAFRESGQLVPTTPPHGLSGGPIFDLGDALSVDQLCAAEPHPARLTGILIECPRQGGVLIGTKVEVLRDYARRAKALCARS